MAVPPRLYMSPPSMMGDEETLVIDALRSGWIAPLGPHVDAFEREIAEKVGAKGALALSSGTAALHLALVVLGIKPGDEIWTSTLSFIASANPAAYIDTELMFFDSEESTWNIDSDLVLSELTKRADNGERLPSAIIVVDIFGQCANFDPFLTFCDDYGIPVIEDACEALGATYRGRSAGTFGCLSAISFNGNKIITCGGGGMLLASTDEGMSLLEKARFLSTQARDPGPHYQHSMIGYNYRMSNILAALGRGQLRGLADKIKRRHEIRERYEQRLGHLPGLKFMPISPDGKPNYWLTCITIDASLFGATREQVRVTLENENIEARPVWKPLHLQPVFRNCLVVGGSVSERLFRQGLCLPSGDQMSDEDIDRVADVIECSALQLLSVEEAKELDIEWPDIYFDPGYGHAAELSEPVDDHASWEVAIWRNGCIIYPYIKRPIPNSELLFDLVSPYGYSGIFCSDESELPKFRSAFEKRAVQRGYVTEFFRFSSLVADPLLFAHHVTIEQLGATVSVDLSKGWQHTFDAATGRHRTAVRKAVKSGLVARVLTCTEDLVLPGSHFRKLYESAMQSLNASPFYTFPDEYYKRLVHAFDEDDRELLVAHVFDTDDAVVCAGLFMCYRGIVHYHLSASDRSSNATNLMIDAVIKYACDKNARMLHLGGGVGGRRDSLFNFKASIGGTELPFFVGRSVLQPKLYDDLVKNYRGNSHDQAHDGGYFPEYRSASST